MDRFNERSQIPGTDPDKDSSEAESLQFLQHLFVMGGGPVDPAATGAPEKLLLGGKNVRRHRSLDGVLGARLQPAVARQAAPEQFVMPGQLISLDDLAQLSAKIVAFDEEEFRRLFSVQASVAGQDDTAFTARRPNQTITGQMPAIDNVLADDTKPFCQPAEHSVGGKRYAPASARIEFELIRLCLEHR